MFVEKQTLNLRLNWPFKLGRFGGYVLSQHETGRPKVFVARDTRISGEMLESALVAGLLSVGIEVYKLGVLATPGVSYLVRTENASAGVMISASHNPALDNGIKFFGGDGFKLDDAREVEIEALLDAAEDTASTPLQLKDLEPLLIIQKVFVNMKNSW